MENVLMNKCIWHLLTRKIISSITAFSYLYTGLAPCYAHETYVELMVDHRPVRPLSKQVVHPHKFDTLKRSFDLRVDEPCKKAVDLDPGEVSRYFAPVKPVEPVLAGKVANPRLPEPITHPAVMDKT